MHASTPPVSMDEMIATTKRGVWVTRFDNVNGDGFMTATGYTRDGVWLIENGKVSKPVKNFRFEEQPFSLLLPARLEQIGSPMRVFSPTVPILVPALKVKDFNFTQLIDAI